MVFLKEKEENMASLRDSYIQAAMDSGIDYILNDQQLKELKSVLLEMLHDVLDVCNRYNITIALCGGSALGAVRHKGFIPWDDDLDVLMPRKDYERFKSIFPKEMSEKYYIAGPNIAGLSKQRFPKIFKKNTVYRSLSDVDSKLPSEIYIDIFPVENVPSNKVLRFIKGSWCDFLMFCGTRVYLYEHDNEIYRSYMSATPKSKKKFERVIKTGKFLSFMSSKKWFDKIDRAVQYSKNTGLCSIPTGRKHYFGETLKEEYFFPVTKGQFEGMDVPLPADCDKYLSNLYGDYMKIPPEEKREKHFVVEFDSGR